MPDRAPRSPSFKDWLEANKKPNEAIEDVDDSAPQIKSAIDRSARFLSLASLVAVLLCAIAVAMAARRYVHRHLDSVALMKTLGATRGFTLTVSLTQLTLVGLLAAVLGSLLGFGAQAWLVMALEGLLKRRPAARRGSRRWASASSPPSRCSADSRCRRCCSCRARRRCASCVATSGRRSRW